MWKLIKKAESLEGLEPEFSNVVGMNIPMFKVSAVKKSNTWYFDGMLLEENNSQYFLYEYEYKSLIKKS